MRWLPLSLIALVAVLLAALPASALGAEAAGVPAEAPASETPPPSTGWVPQSPAAEGSDDAQAPAQQGSSLGSGESPKQSAPPSQPPSSTEPPPPPTTSTDSYEPEPSAPPIAEERTSALEEESAVSVTPPVVEAKPDPGVPPAVGAADMVARSVSSGKAEADGSSSAAAQVASASVEGASDSGGLPWLALILCGLILLYAGMRLLLGPVEPEFFRSGRFRFFRRVFPGA
jgi:hypothetical protein